MVWFLWRGFPRRPPSPFGGSGNHFFLHLTSSRRGRASVYHTSKTDGKAHARGCTPETSQRSDLVLPSAASAIAWRKDHSIEGACALSPPWPSLFLGTPHFRRFGRCCAPLTPGLLFCSQSSSPLELAVATPLFFTRHTCARGF